MPRSIAYLQSNIPDPPKEPREEDSQFYSHRRWRRVRLRKLAMNPLCEKCEAEGRHLTCATQVHHIKERRDAPEFSFEISNLMSLCVPCHGSMRRGKRFNV